MDRGSKAGAGGVLLLLLLPALGMGLQGVHVGRGTSFVNEEALFGEHVWAAHTPVRHAGWAWTGG